MRPLDPTRSASLLALLSLAPLAHGQLGRLPEVPGTGTPTRHHAGGETQSSGPHVGCAGRLRDQASGACTVRASTTPTPGMLYPLGVDLFVDAATHRVGVGTLAPTEALDVQGRVRATGGIRFGDGTLQTTAQPAGPAGPPPQLTPIGTADFSATGCPGTAALAIYGLECDLTSAAELAFEKDFDRCSPALMLACNQSTTLADVHFSIGGLTLALYDVRVTSIGVDDLAQGLPRERVQLSWGASEWSYSGPDGSSQATWDPTTATGGAAPLQSSFHFAWFGANANPTTAPGGVAGAQRVGFEKDSPSGGASQFADLRIVRAIDSLSPQLLYLGLSGQSSTEVVADLVTEPGSTYLPHLRYRLTQPSVTRTSFTTAPGGELLQEVAFDYEIITWTYHPGRPDQTESFWNTVTNTGG